jgi:hypothetical protein
MARGWAGRLLNWSWRGVQLEAEVARVKYFVRADRCEALAWAEVRDVDGRHRAEVGSYRTVVEARAACERDCELRCRRAGEERGPVSVAIGGRRRAGAAKAEKGRELGGRNYRPCDRDLGEARDEALRAFAG